MLLAYYDNKGLLALAAKHLKNTKRSSFEHWFRTALTNGSIPGLTKAIRKSLPRVPSR